MNKDTYNLFESYRLVLERKNGTKKVENDLKKAGYREVSDKKAGHNKDGRTFIRKIDKGIERDVTVKGGKEKLHVHRSEDNQEAVSEAGAFLHRLAARLQADQSNSYTNEDIFKLKEIANRF